MYRGSIPTIAKAYENDPRTKLAQAATALGTSVDPVADGNWGISQGLARVAQAIAGGYIQKQQNKQYSAREQEYIDAMRGALPSDAPAPMAAAAAALGPDGAPPAVSPVDVPSGAPAPLLASPGPMQAPVPMAPPAPDSAPASASATPPAPTGPAAMPAPPQPYAAPPVMGPGGASPGSGVTVPTMEAVAPLVQIPAVAPAAPALPKAPTSASMAYARKLIESGNPDLAVLGETFLAKGLGETTEIARDANTQQFQQGQTGYTAALADYGDARRTGREATVQERAGALNRNFQRYGTYVDQRFKAGQGDKDRANALEIAKLRENGEWARLAIKLKAEKNPYYDTPTGLKMRDAANKVVNDNENLKGKIDLFLTLNERTSTGGVSGNIPMRSMFDKDYATMDGLSKETTIEKLGGLGVAISDGDRKFVESSGLNMGKPLASNQLVGQVLKNVLDRKSERELAFGDAQANGITQRTFNREWKRYINEEPIVRFDAVSGNNYVPKEIPSFLDWQEAQKKPVVR